MYGIPSEFASVSAESSRARCMLGGANDEKIQRKTRRFFLRSFHSTSSTRTRAVSSTRLFFSFLPSFRLSDITCVMIVLPVVLMCYHVIDLSFCSSPAVVSFVFDAAKLRGKLRFSHLRSWLTET